MSTTQLSRQPAAEGLYEFAGRLLAVRIEDERSADDILEFIRGNQLTKTSQPTARTPDCVIEFLTGEAPPLPHGIRAFKVPHGVCLTDWKSYFLFVEDSRVDVGPPPRSHVAVRFGDTERARCALGIANVTSYALQAGMRRCGLFDFHAACLVAPGTSAGFLFAGPPNSGKSTLTLRLIVSGWRYLTDDTAVLEETPDGVTAMGLRRSFSVDPEALEALDLTGVDRVLGSAIPSNPRKRFFNPEAIFPSGLARSCRPRVLCFPRVTGEEVSRVERLSRSQTMSLLIKYNPWAGYDVVAARAHLRVLGRLAGQTESLRLHAGRDLLRDPGGAHKLLAPYAERWRTT